MRARGWLVATEKGYDVWIEGADKNCIPFVRGLRPTLAKRVLNDLLAMIEIFGEPQ